MAVGLISESSTNATFDDLSIRHVRRLLRSEQLLAVMAVATAIWLRIRFVDTPSGYVVLTALAIPVPATEWALRRARADNLVPIVLGMLGLYWSATLVLAPLAPFALPIMPFAVLVPLLAAGPIFDGARLRLLIAGATVAMTAITALALLAPSSAIDDAIPVSTRHSIVISALALRTVTVSFSVLDANRRRTRSVAALSEANTALRAANEALASSRARVVSVADEERRRIERDLHDGAQQQLVAVSLRLRLVGARHPDAAEDVALLADELGAAIEELRELAHGIYPPLLAHRGLPDALAAACRRVPLDTTLVADGVERYDPAIETAVYFVCLEALQNASKHAGPGGRVRVTVRHTAAGVTLEVTDDGPGFDPLDAGASGRGMRNMADRLGAVGAELILESAAGAGTTLRTVVPLPR